MADLNKLIGAPVDVLRVFVMYKFQIEKGLNSSDNDRHANPEVGERPMAKCINGYRYLFDAFVAKFCAGATCKSGESIFDVREALCLECARIFDQHQKFLRYLMEETNPSKRISRSPCIVDLPKSDSPFLGGQLNNDNYIIDL